MQRAVQIFRLLQRRGLAYILYLLYGVAAQQLTYLVFWRYRTRLRPVCALLGVCFSLSAMLFLWRIGAFVSVWQLILWTISPAALVAAIWSAARAIKFHITLKKLQLAIRSQRIKSRFLSWENWLAGSALAAEVVKKHTASADLVLGSIDNDGRACGLYGAIPGFQNVDPSNHVPRYRFPLDIVIRDGAVLIRKDFRGNPRGLIREAANLLVLQSHMVVPPVFDIDINRCVLYKGLLLGTTLRDHMVAAGARILTVQTQSEASLQGFSEPDKIAAVWQRGRQVLASCTSNRFVTELTEQMNIAHRFGVAKLSLTFGNVIVDPQGHPVLLDFEGSRLFPSTGSIQFRLARDGDREKFNQIYGTDLLTEASARRLLASTGKQLGGWYAPADFGGGLVTRGFWSTDNGTGRWDFFNKQILSSLLLGKRILDLGSNNGIMPIMMLRSGAKEVLGVELLQDFADCAYLIRRIFEWRDIRTYNLHIHMGNMLDVLDHDWGRFDIVTAFCSLYYLEPEEMAAVVRKASALAPVMILQAKSDTRPDAADDKAKKSSPQFLKNLLEKNGFPHVEVFTREGFSRPLLVGRVAKDWPHGEDQAQSETATEGAVL